MRMRIPAMMMMIEKKIFQSLLVRSTARLPRVNSPPTSQYAPRNVMKITVVMPGDVMNMIPVKKVRMPHTNKSHQGKSFTTVTGLSGGINSVMKRITCVKMNKPSI